MAYDKALISSILRQLEQQHDRCEAEAESRRYQLTMDIPRLAEIDRELRGTAAKAMRIAFESNNTDAAIEQLKQRNLALQAEKRQLLLDNGYPADYLAVTVSCPICRDTGYDGNRLCTCVKRRAAELQKQNLSTLLPVDKETFSTFRLDYYSSQPDSRFGLSPRQMAQANLQRCHSFAEHSALPMKICCCLVLPVSARPFYPPALPAQSLSTVFLSRMTRQFLFLTSTIPSNSAPATHLPRHMLSNASAMQTFSSSMTSEPKCPAHFTFPVCMISSADVS